MAAHRLGDALAILAILNALSRNVLDLGTSVIVLDIRIGGLYQQEGLPVLEPNLHRSLGHVDLVCNSLTDSGGRGGVLVELHF